MSVVLEILRWLIAIGLVYLFLIAPNILHRKLRRKELLGWYYAHRGLHDDNHLVPENSLPAFQKAVDKGFSIELDVHLTKDQQLVVHHDNSLKRLCGDSRLISETTLSEIQHLELGQSGESVPTLDQVLALVDGRVPLIIELKSDKQGDTALATLLNARMQTYGGVYCVESFDPLLMRWYKKHAPKVVRGQLAVDPRYTKKGKYADVKQFCAAYLLGNFLSRPDFVAYGYKTDRNLSFRVLRSLFRPMLAAWTVRSKEDSEKLERAYDLQIFEAFEP